MIDPRRFHRIGEGPSQTVHTIGGRAVGVTVGTSPVGRGLDGVTNAPCGCVVRVTLEAHGESFGVERAGRSCRRHAAYWRGFESRKAPT